MMARTIKSACVRATAIAVAAVAASAALTVHAANRNWIGGEEGVANTPESPYAIQNLANWDGSGATGSDDLYLSATERTYIHKVRMPLIDSAVPSVPTPVSSCSLGRC